MSYPILTLPYPFAKRLRQLLDPFELEELQKAAGPYVRNELKPIVESRKMDVVFMSAYVLSYMVKHMNAPHANLINCLESLNLLHLTSSDFENATTTQLLIRTKRIGFFECHVSNALLNKLSKIVVRPFILEFRYSHRFDEDVKFSTIIKIFPSVCWIGLGKAYSGWLDDLISTRTLFKAIEIFHDNFDELFSFKPAELYDYVKTQHSTFRILLSYKVNAYRYDWVIHMMQKFIDPRFDIKKNGRPKVTLRVQLIDNPSFYHAVRYYYKK
uniref:F-box domain-containing protein n=1 Tax=Panagrellus redivivus TaxID=6233 RepID=A0A7E4VXT2_PANRE